MTSLRRATAVRVVVGFLLSFTLLATVFAVGEAMTDPGGWLGVGLAALWVAPMLALMTFCWFRPDTSEHAIMVLAVLVGVVVLVLTFADDLARDLEDDHGPVRSIVLLALGGILGVLALQRPRTSGRTLTTLAAVVLATRFAGLDSQPLMVVAVPLFVAGVLIWAMAPGREPPTPPIEATR